MHLPFFLVLTFDIKGGVRIQQEITSIPCLIPVMRRTGHHGGIVSA